MRFLKDGYTDFRGSFSYAETNSIKLKNIEWIAVLIKSDTLGSAKREVKAPANIEVDVQDIDL